RRRSRTSSARTRGSTGGCTGGGRRGRRGRRRSSTTECRSPSVAVRLKAKERGVPGEDRLPGEAGGDVGTGGGGEAIAQRGVVEEAGDGGGQGGRVARGDEQAGGLVADDVADAGDVGGDDGDAGGHRLDEHEAEALGLAGE